MTTRSQIGSLAQGGAFALLALVALLALGVTRPAVAADDPQATSAGPSGAATSTEPVRTHVLAKIYQSGNARMSRGDTSGAFDAFKSVAEIAPELRDAQYSKALAALLNDFAHRDEALR